MLRGRAEARLCPCCRSGGQVIRLLAITAAVFTIAVLAGDARAQLRPDVVAYWMRIHRCEQPDAWHHHFHEYQGGLGISNGAWTWWAGELGLLDRYRTAGLAPPLVQIRVADYGWRRYRGSWGCMRVVGFPPR